MRAVALLRGVNLAGKTRVGMPELRALAEEIGLTDVSTYLQSGNLVFSATATDGLAARLEKALASTLAFAPKVVVRTADELKAIAARHPYAADEPLPARLHVVFLRDVPAADRKDDLDPERSPGDRFALRGRELYVHYAGGQARTKLTLDYIERRLGTVGTARNWNTVQKLRELTADGA